MCTYIPGRQCVEEQKGNTSHSHTHTHTPTSIHSSGVLSRCRMPERREKRGQCRPLVVCSHLASLACGRTTFAVCVCVRMFMRNSGAVCRRTRDEIGCERATMRAHGFVGRVRWKMYCTVLARSPARRRMAGILECSICGGNTSFGHKFNLLRVGMPDR